MTIDYKSISNFKLNIPKIHQYIYNSTTFERQFKFIGNVHIWEYFCHKNMNQYSHCTTLLSLLSLYLPLRHDWPECLIESVFIYVTFIIVKIFQKISKINCSICEIEIMDPTTRYFIVKVFCVMGKLEKCIGIFQSS